MTALEKYRPGKGDRECGDARNECGQESRDLRGWGEGARLPSRGREGAIHSLPLKGEGCGAGVRSLQAEGEKYQGPEAGAVPVFGNQWG